MARLKHIADNDADYVEALDMLGELRDDTQALIARMVEIHGFAMKQEMWQLPAS